MQTRKAMSMARLLAAVLLAAAATVCAGKQAPVARPTPPSPPPAAAAPRTAQPAEPVREAPIAPPEPIAEDSVASRSLDDLNRTSPLRPVFFEYDSSEMTPVSRSVLDGNATLLRKYAGWIVTIEGHCDERGTAEYNLALGERRAVTARTYLVSLGIDAKRLRTVSYGKEFPFDPGHDEAAWSTNRRAHFVITAK